jgi:hypothetical protein
MTESLEELKNRYRKALAELTLRYEGAKSYRGSYLTTCPTCDSEVEGDGIIATGLPLPYPHSDHSSDCECSKEYYTPQEGELLKNLEIVCRICGWNQYS